MNRSLLLIVCDFLLLSLLGLVDFEHAGQARVDPHEITVEAESDESSVDPMVMELLEEALTAEKDAQDELEEQLRENREQQEAEARERERLQAELAAREESLSEQSEALARSREEAEAIALAKEEAEAEARRIAAEKEELAARRAQLEEAVRNLEQTVSGSREELENSSAEMKQLRERLEENETKLTKAEREREESRLQAREMETRLQATARERELLASNLDSARQTIELVRQDKQILRRQTDTLTEGVTRLARNSESIQDEVRNLRPQTANEIFNTIRSNEVTIQFSGQKRGLFGGSPIQEELPTVLTRIGDRYYVWIHLSQTPFASPQSRPFIESLSATIRIGDARFRIPKLGILADDARLLYLPVPASAVEDSGLTAFPATQDPFRFEQLVVADPRNSRYGETGFRINPEKKNFLSVDRRVFSSLFGEFSAGPGDLAFTKAGDFLGIVLRSGEAWRAEEVRSSGTLSLGENFNPQSLESLPEP